MATHGGNSATPETELATRRSPRLAPRGAAHLSTQPPPPRLVRAPTGPARRRASDRPGWLHRAAQLLYRLPAGATRDRADRGAPGGRGGLAVPHRRPAGG